MGTSCLLLHAACRLGRNLCACLRCARSESATCDAVMISRVTLIATVCVQGLSHYYAEPADRPGSAGSDTNETPPTNGSAAGSAAGNFVQQGSTPQAAAVKPTGAKLEPNDEWDSARIIAYMRKNLSSSLHNKNVKVQGDSAAPTPWGDVGTVLLWPFAERPPQVTVNNKKVFRALVKHAISSDQLRVLIPWEVRPSQHELA